MKKLLTVIKTKLVNAVKKLSPQAFVGITLAPLLVIAVVAGFLSRGANKHKDPLYVLLLITDRGILAEIPLRKLHYVNGAVCGIIEEKNVPTCVKFPAYELVEVKE